MDRFELVVLRLKARLKQRESARNLSISRTYLSRCRGDRWMLQDVLLYRDFEEVSQ